MIGGVRSHTTSHFLQSSWGGHGLAFGDDLFPLIKIIPYMCVLLDSSMRSFCVRSCSLLEEEYSRSMPYISFALSIRYIPFRVAKSSRRRAHGLLGINNRVFDAHFNPSALQLPSTTFIARVCHNIPSPLFSDVLLTNAHFLHGFQFFGYHTSLFMATSALTLENCEVMFLPVSSTAPFLFFQ